MGGGEGEGTKKMVNQQSVSNFSIYHHFPNNLF